MVKSIQVSDENWEMLSLLKVKLRKKSFNEVISVLLSSYKSIDLQNYRSIKLQNYKPIELQNYKSIESQKTEEEEEIVSGEPEKEVVEIHESIQSPIKGMEEALKGISDVIVEASEIIEKEEKEGVSAEKEEEEEERPATIGDAIVMILSERAREPKELLKMLIDMGFPAKESEKTIEELIKKDVIEVCEVQLGRWGKQTFLRLKEKEKEVKEE